jgi:hypothetical protein
MAVEEGQSRCLGGRRDPGRFKKGPGRLRGAGLVALNPLTSGQSRHPTVIHATAPGATMGEIDGDRGGVSGRLTTWGLARMTVG